MCTSNNLSGFSSQLTNESGKSTVCWLPRLLCRSQGWFSCLLLAHCSTLSNSAKIVPKAFSSMCSTSWSHPIPHHGRQTRNQCVLLFPFPDGAQSARHPSLGRFRLKTTKVDFFQTPLDTCDIKEPML